MKKNQCPGKRQRKGECVAVVCCRQVPFGLGILILKEGILIFEVVVYTFSAASPVLHTSSV